MHYILLLFIIFIAGCSSEPEKTMVAATVPPMFTSPEQTVPPAKESAETVAPVASAGQIIELNDELLTLEKGESFSFQEPGKAPVLLEITNRFKESGGNVTISGSGQGSSGPYRLTATIGAAGAYGRIETPTTIYRITVNNGKTVLIDLNGPGNIIVPKDKNDALIPPGTPARNSAQNSQPSLAAEPLAAESPPLVTGKTTIDLMILYTPGMAAAHPGTDLETRLNALVGYANAAYAASGVDIYLRLVHAEQITYTDSNSNATALANLTYGATPFAGVEALRQLHGADLVTLVRPYDYPTRKAAVLPGLTAVTEQ